jgi:ParB family transcriptional regulator, chromosome partitioning protein
MTLLHMDKDKQSTLGQKLKKDVFFGVSADLPRIIEIELQKLRPNPDQPRTTFSPEALQELANSIEQHGLIQPIAVVEDREQGGFIIVAGERRYRAYKLLGKETIAAITTSGNPDEIALIENMQREDLSPIDEAEALGKLMGRHNYKPEDLAKVIGKARTTVVELLSLNNLPEQIKSECRTSDNLASKSVLIEIVRLGKPKDQLKFWKSFKQGEKKTVRVARAHKGGKKVLAQKSVAKPKQTFHTTREASVIVQAENPKELSREQVVGALEEARKA